MTIVATLDPHEWLAVTTTEAVLVTGRIFEIAFAAAKPANSDQGHIFQGPFTIPQGSKAYIRAGSSNGTKVRISSLGATAVAPVDPLRFDEALQLHAVNAAPGSAVTLTLKPLGGKTPYTYSWAKEDVTLAGKTAATLTFAAVAASDAATYRGFVTDADGKVIGTPIVLTVG